MVMNVWGILLSMMHWRGKSRLTAGSIEIGKETKISKIGSFSHHIIVIIVRSKSTLVHYQKQNRRRRRHRSCAYMLSQQ